MIKRYELIPDIHHPHHNKPAIEAVLQFTEWFRPDGLCLLGDGLSMDSINHWEMAKGNKDRIVLIPATVVKDLADFYMRKKTC